jgi:flagellar basal-body rod protein FlgB
MLSKIDQDLSFVHTALNLRARRQEVLASNIANSDTPNYKARDLDFTAALKSATGAAGGPLQLARTSERHIGASASGFASDLLKYRSSLQPSLDGNTVDMDVERANFTENSLHYQFLLDRAAGEFKTLGSAITDK